MPTLISLWSAMFGGAFGALAGTTSGYELLNGIIGSVWGFACSVPISIMLMTAAQVMISMAGSDIDDAPIGCATTSQLSGVIGGLTGLIGAVVLTGTTQGHRVTNPRTFFICWSVSASVAVALVLAAVFRERFLSDL